MIVVVGVVVIVMTFALMVVVVGVIVVVMTVGLVGVIVIVVVGVVVVVIVMAVALVGVIVAGPEFDGLGVVGDVKDRRARRGHRFEGVD